MKTQKTLAETVDQLGKDIARMEKKVAAMRRRIGAITRKHAKLQQRIQKLSEQGRIISLSHDSRIVVGIDCWYTFSDSLNVDKDAPTNFYYETTWNAEAGYGCSCEAVGDCRHIRELGSTFAPIAQPVAAPQKQEEEQRYIAPLNRRDGAFSILR